MKTCLVCNIKYKPGHEDRNLCRTHRPLLWYLIFTPQGATLSKAGQKKLMEMAF